jgi:hypothetical protein
LASRDGFGTSRTGGDVFDPGAPTDELADLGGSQRLAGIDI